MKVKLISTTHNPVILMYIAARTCYSEQVPSKIFEDAKNLRLEKMLKLLKSVLKKGHLSIAEHVNFTFAIDGISRACSHQLVRHRHCTFCLSGSTKIQRFNKTTMRHDLTLSEIYKRWNDYKLKSSIKTMLIRSVDNNNKIIPAKIKNVFYSGDKDVFEITTKLGYKIKASEDHIFFNNIGEVKLKNLNIGDNVYINGLPLYKELEWFSNMYINKNLTTTQIANICNVSPTTARKWKRIHNIKTISSNMKRTFNTDTKNKISQAHKGKLLSNMHKNKLSDTKMGSKNPRYKVDRTCLLGSGLRAEQRKFKLSYCELCGSTNKLEAHHIDKNINNFDTSNLLTVCSDCHKLIHRGYVIKKVILDTITDINYVGVEKTYDLEMFSPHHNFIANGFKVHNSQQSQRYVKFKGFDSYITPNTINRDSDVSSVYAFAMDKMQDTYDYLIEEGIPAEDARMILPNACTTNLVMTCNLRELMHICNLRLCSRAQWEIRELVEEMKKQVVEWQPWLEEFLVPNCKNCTDECVKTNSTKSEQELQSELEFKPDEIE